MKRQIPGKGKVRRYLGTKRKAVARRREEALLALAEKGHQDVVQAWLDGDLSPGRGPKAWESGDVHIERHGRTKGEPIFQVPRRTVQKEHRRARERIGRPGYTIHDHRHTAAVHLARAGMPLNLLQEQLGHANVEQTMRYARFHPDYGDVAEYFDRVDERLGLGAPAPDNSSDDTPAPDGEEAAGVGSG